MGGSSRSDAGVSILYSDAQGSPRVRHTCVHQPNGTSGTGAVVIYSSRYATSPIQTRITTKMPCNLQGPVSAAEGSGAEADGARTKCETLETLVHNVTHACCAGINAGYLPVSSSHPPPGSARPLPLGDLTAVSPRGPLRCSATRPAGHQQGRTTQREPF